MSLVPWDQGTRAWVTVTCKSFAEINIILLFTKTCHTAGSPQGEGPRLRVLVKFVSVTNNDWSVELPCNVCIYL